MKGEAGRGRKGAAERPLPYDVQRCTGRMDLGPHAEWCDQRRTCKRFMAFMFWDLASGVPHYRGIAVSGAVPNCQHKIEVEDDRLERSD